MRIMEAGTEGLTTEYTECTEMEKGSQTGSSLFGRLQRTRWQSMPRIITLGDVFFILVLICGHSRRRLEQR